MLLVPSSRVLLLLRAVPLTFVVRDRAGVSVMAFWKPAGVVPGTRFSRLW